jgi:predicted aminopeptidase
VFFVALAWGWRFAGPLGYDDPMRTFRPIPVLLLLLSLLSLSGCEEVGFYAQAARGQLGLIWDRQSIPTLLQKPQTPARLRARLQTVQDIRAFAGSQLGLPAAGDFGYYVELGRPFPVWSVMASPELALTPYSWCYPLLGCLDYRGYFSQSGADALAGRLRSKGLEVAVSGATTYSTLGHLNDPILSSFVYEPDADLAQLIFHELSHVLLFVPGDTVFNESFAVTVAAEGLQRFSKVHPLDLPARQAADARESQFVALVLRYRQQLQALYASPLSVAEKRAEKQRIYAAMRQDYADHKQVWGGFAGYDRWMAHANNALLNGVATYYDDVPALQALLASKQHDLPAFYAACRELAKLTPEQRKAALQQQLKAGA